MKLSSNFIKDVVMLKIPQHCTLQCIDLSNNIFDIITIKRIYKCITMAPKLQYVNLSNCIGNQYDNYIYIGAIEVLIGKELINTSNDNNEEEEGSLTWCENLLGESAKKIADYNKTIIGINKTRKKAGLIELNECMITNDRIITVTNDDNNTTITSKLLINRNIKYINISYNDKGNEFNRLAMHDEFISLLKEKSLQLKQIENDDFPNVKAIIKVSSNSNNSNSNNSIHGIELI